MCIRDRMNTAVAAEHLVHGAMEFLIERHRVDELDVLMGIVQL